jgi:hypothetical protein
MPERRVTVSPGLRAVPGPPEMAWLGSMGKLWHYARLAVPGGARGPALGCNTGGIVRPEI